MMKFCTYCQKKCTTERTDCGFLCCTGCGKVVDNDNFSTDPVFVKNADGQSKLSGNFVRTVQSDYSVSRQRTLNNAEDELSRMIYALSIQGGDSLIRQSLAFYTIALERNFTRGRRVDQVAAACLYIACRENKKPYLLIDFSDHLKVNVYLLGAVFLQLSQLLRLEEHPIIQKPVDPSLFIHKFTNSLLGEQNIAVSKTALRIIGSMKRDWMQTGRKPSGLCGAALYISALSHGLECFKTDIIRVVHICEATLTKRLIEFESTESGSLTIEEFNRRAEELDKQCKSAKQLNSGFKLSDTSELLCEHKGSDEPHYAHGLCRTCYHEFIDLSGGLEGGLEPPAFQRAERERMIKASSEENPNDSSFVLMPCQTQNNSKQLNPEKEMGNPRSASENEKLKFRRPKGVTIDADNDKNAQAFNQSVSDLSESLSDIDEDEVNSYLHNEEEKHFKKIIWEKMNWEYLKEQAAKEAEAEATRKAIEANFKNNCPEDMLGAQELEAAVAAINANKKKERQQRRAEERKNRIPAQTAAEATRQSLTKKRLSSKINYDVLEKLFDEPVVDPNKKSRTASNPNSDDDISKPFNASELSQNNYDSGVENVYEEEGDDNGGYYDGNYVYGNVEEEGYNDRCDYGDEEY